MGLGKSIMSIFTFSQLYKEGKIDSIFLVSKNGLSYHWLREILMFSNVFKKEDILLVNNENKKKVFTENKDKKIIITPNHLLADIFVSYRKKQKKFDEKKKKLKRINNSDRRWGRKYFSIKNEWDKKSIQLIVDEAHCFKNSNSTMSKSLECFISEFDYRGFLSGTPSINRFEEFYFQMKLLDPYIFNQTEGSFLISIAKRIGDPFNPWAIQSYNEQKILEYKDRLKMNCLKMVKEDLPEMKTRRIIKKVFVELNPIQKQIYDYYSNQETTENKANNRKITRENIFRYFMKVCQTVDNTLLLEAKSRNDYINKLLSRYDFSDDPRLEYLDEYLKESIEDQNEKVVIFDTHPLTLDMLEERYYKYKPITIHGSKNTTEQERQTAQDIFNDKNSECKLILLSSLTSSTGINLQKGSHKVVFFTTPWNTTDYRQALDRTYRITSEKDTIVVILVFAETIDEVRVERNLNRTEFNDTYLNKELNEEDISRLLNGT
jgi:ATP-dependent DNA helicase